MDEAHACGAAPLADRAAEELRATGARPRRRAISGRDALTASELRVATLAAAGRTNRQAAEELFVTLATIETHLSRTYRKLGIAGRAALAQALSAEPVRRRGLAKPAPEGWRPHVPARPGHSALARRDAPRSGSRSS